MVIFMRVFQALHLQHFSLLISAGSPQAPCDAVLNK